MAHESVRRQYSAAGLLVGLRIYATSEHLVEFTLAGALAGFMAPMQYLLWLVRRRQHAIEMALPNVLVDGGVRGIRVKGSTRPLFR